MLLDHNPSLGGDTATGSVVCPFCSRSSEASWLGSVILLEPPDAAVRSMMIAPARHVESLSAMSPGEIEDTFEVIDLIRRDWSRGQCAADANVIWNLGLVAGQSVAHVHCHLVERTQSGPLPGYGARWWLKSGLRGGAVLKLVAWLNWRTRAGGHSSN